MVPQKLNAIENMIHKLTSFSCLHLFGHLFVLHPAHLRALHAAEKYCRIVLDIQLRLDFESDCRVSYAHQMTIAKSELEQKLGSVFHTNAPFWEKYYFSINQIQNNNPKSSKAENWTCEQLAQKSRTDYSAFYTMLDALYFAGKNFQSDYSLLQLSLQSYLRSHLLLKNGFKKESKEAISDALKLLGHVNAPEYRDLIKQCFIQ